VVSPEHALQILDPTKHRPNDLVVFLGSKTLGSRKIWETFLEWCRLHEIGDWWHRLRFMEEWGSKFDSE
jgi:hypothetical protein